jgi:hypothetical protein
MDEITPQRIIGLGMGFWNSKALLSAVELGVFTELAKGPANLAELSRRLGLHDRSAGDFLDALVALEMLERDGDTYRNTPETDRFLDRAKPSYVGGILEMANARLYGYWGSLTEALRSGKPQNEAKDEEDFFGSIYADHERLKGFLAAMSGISAGVAQAIATKFPWENYQTFLDVGAAQGTVPVTLSCARTQALPGRAGRDQPTLLSSRQNLCTRDYDRSGSIRVSEHASHRLQDNRSCTDVSGGLPSFESAHGRVNQICWSGVASICVPRGFLVWWIATPSLRLGWKPRGQIQSLSATAISSVSEPRSALRDSPRA